MSAPQQQQLVQKNVLTAYLQPLLAKHEAQKPITYEDLIASWHAATAALARETNNNNKAHVSSVEAELKTLHQGQLRAYRDAAKAALVEWAETVPLPEASGGGVDLATYQQRCRTMVSVPAWKQVHKMVLQTAYERLEERAAEAHSQLLVQQQQQNSATTTTSTSASLVVVVAAEEQPPQDEPVGGNEAEPSEGVQDDEEEEEGEVDEGVEEREEEEQEEEDEQEEGEEKEDAAGSSNEEEGEVLDEKDPSPEKPKQPNTAKANRKKGGILAKRTSLAAKQGKLGTSTVQKKKSQTKATITATRGRSRRGRGRGGASSTR